MSAYNKATPAERFKISEIAIHRLRRKTGKEDFDWSAFVAMRETVAREQGRKTPAWRRALARMCDRLIRRLVKFRLAVLDD